MRRRNEPHFVSKFDQRPPPMMRRGARLHRHHARRQLDEERDQLAAREFARHNDLALRVDCVNLKHSLRQIETNPRDSQQIPDRLAHGRLPFRWGFDNDHLGTLMPFVAPSTPSFIVGWANGSNRPFADLQDRPFERVVSARKRSLASRRELRQLRSPSETRRERLSSRRLLTMAEHRFTRRGSGLSCTQKRSRQRAAEENRRRISCAAPSSSATPNYRTTAAEPTCPLGPIVKETPTAPCSPRARPDSG
jgi:hypothetical protein